MKLRNTCWNVSIVVACIKASLNIMGYVNNFRYLCKIKSVLIICYNSYDTPIGNGDHT